MSAIVAETVDTPVFDEYVTGDSVYLRQNSKLILEGQPDFNKQLMSRIEKADKRIGVISLKEFSRRLEIRMEELRG